MDFEYRIAKKSDVAALDALMQKVNRSIEDKAIFSADDLESIERHIEDEGRIVAAFDGEQLVSFFMLRYPKDAPDNLGLDLGYDKEALSLVAHMESIVVDFDYRGHGLQQILMAKGEEIAIAEGYKHLLCTVSPDNPYSLNNALKRGFEIVKTKEKYGGFMRHILYKKVN